MAHLIVRCCPSDTTWESSCVETKRTSTSRAALLKKLETLADTLISGLKHPVADKDILANELSREVIDSKAVDDDIKSYFEGISGPAESYAELALISHQLAMYSIKKLQ